jgi:hypothetical protein
MITAPAIDPARLARLERIERSVHGHNAPPRSEEPNALQSLCDAAAAINELIVREAHSLRRLEDLQRHLNRVPFSASFHQATLDLLDEVRSALESRYGLGADEIQAIGSEALLAVETAYALGAADRLDDALG